MGRRRAPKLSIAAPVTQPAFEHPVSAGGRIARAMFVPGFAVPAVLPPGT